MAKKKQTKLTVRQQESQRIMREKSARKKREALIHRLQVGVLVSAALLFVGCGFWMWKTNAVSRTTQAISDGVYALTVDAGFAVNSLYLEGRSRTPMEEINKAIAIHKGAPILKLSLADLRQSLEKVGSIRVAAVERELPDRLIVRIIERDPVALWQHDGKLVLVDDNGVPMPDIDMRTHKNLPLIVGKGAPAYVKEVLSLLATDETLSKRFKAAVRISERRWNIHLKDGTQVKLPEQEPTKAWETLAKLNEKQQLLDRDVSIIDLRVAGRLFIKVPSENSDGSMPGAKET